MDDETTTVHIALSAAEVRLVRDALNLNRDALCLSQNASDVRDQLARRIELAHQYHHHRAQANDALARLQDTTPAR